MSTEIILRHGDLPVMILRRYKFDHKRFGIDAAKAELLKQIKANTDDTSHTWGYFPELEKDNTNYPASATLLNDLQNHFFSNIEIQPAFVRLATAEPVSKFGGLHIDVSPGVGHTREYDKGDVLRILLNIGEHPRSLDYCPFDLETIRKKYSLFIPDDHYQSISLPKGVPIKKLEIPPIEDNALWMLSFRSNRVVHAGVTNEDGHFLASFGGVLPEENITKFFEQ